MTIFAPFGVHFAREAKLRDLWNVVYDHSGSFCRNIVVNGESHHPRRHRCCCRLPCSVRRRPPSSAVVRLVSSPPPLALLLLSPVFVLFVIIAFVAANITLGCALDLFE